MAVVQVKLFWTGQTGAWRLGSTREYVSIHHVYTNDKNDGPAVVLTAIGLTLGDPYTNIGNDSDPEIVLVEMIPNRVAGTREKWEVVARWSKPTGNSGGGAGSVDNDGNPTDNPLHRADDIDVSYAQFSEPVYDAIFRSGFKGSSLAKRAAGTPGPVHNSAFTVVKPPLEADNSHLVIRITKTLQTFPTAQAKQYQDAVNSTAFQINKQFQGFNINIPAFQAKMQNIGGVWQLVNNVSLWRVTYELHIWDRAWGWRFRILDEGVVAKADEGDPNGRGGTYSSTDLVQGVPQQRRLVDPAGMPITEPVPLDGEGQPLVLTGATFVYTVWSYYDELNFAPLNL